MWVVGGQSFEQVGSEGVASGEVRRRIYWVGGQGLRLSMDACGASVKAVLVASLSHGGWMGMSGTLMAWHGDNGVVNWCEVVFSCVTDGI